MTQKKGIILNAQHRENWESKVRQLRAGANTEPTTHDFAHLVFNVVDTLGLAASTIYVCQIEDILEALKVEPSELNAWHRKAKAYFDANPTPPVTVSAGTRRKPRGPVN